MRICILGLGVIGTTYGYAFSQAGHHVDHVLRDESSLIAPRTLNIHLYDCRAHRPANTHIHSYDVHLAPIHSHYDFIFISVRNGLLQQAVDTIRSNRLTGTLVIFCNLWDNRSDIESIVDGYPYILAFPTAGGYKYHGAIDSVLLDHVMVENPKNTTCSSYHDLMSLFTHAHIQVETPHDMLEWIWIHMAINAAVTATIGRNGDVSRPQILADEFMKDAHALQRAILTVRETLHTVEARGVDLSLYHTEVRPYMMPSWGASHVMKYMFAHNEPARRIMLMHNDMNDIMYACHNVYRTGEDYHLDMPYFYEAMDTIYRKKPQLATVYERRQ
ncbi:ketopantoate reductase family protein [Alloscardovia theropitheci]|uniref:Ketopantoate reductase family protein n=1 Tax=Alloscardovia theropitheci TaxID=2496842 RepID=A0A4R0QNS0_9BIFI|nr:2-dehydropantoate 2-reductase N-terminal domain-containing protein [Alloscardovia theropitheci]TCD53843.1 ketopantoate reductase family protein [Alloscardovia theropitheci]